MRKLMGVVALIVVVCSSAYAEDPPKYFLKWGSRGNTNGQFGHPHLITTDRQGNVYVADFANQRIQKFDGEGRFLRKWGTYGTGDGQFQYPFGVALDSNGNVYVTEAFGHRVQKFNSEGKFLLKWGSYGAGPGQFNQPTGIAVGPDGSVYVADQYNHRIQKFDCAGNFLRSWGSFGSGNGQLNRPYGVAVDRSGDVFVAEHAGFRVQRFSQDGSSLAIIGYGRLSFPFGVAVDNRGKIYVTEAIGQRVEKFTNEGVTLAEWGSLGLGDGQFATPTGIAVDAQDNVFVAEYDNHRIQKFVYPSQVVLVHGLCSDANAWSTFEPRLRQEGFGVNSLSLIRNNSRPQELVGQLEKFITAVSGKGKVSVVAHSMGGLVVREYIARQPTGHRIARLVTLGTLHHGSDAARYFVKHPKLRKIFFKWWQCALKGPAFDDLVPGSAFLNGLNYGADRSKWDPYAVFVTSHQPEDLRDPTLQYYTISGTRPLCFYPASLISTAWTYSTGDGNIASIANDGMVAVTAGKLYDPNVRNWKDIDLGVGALTHGSSLLSSTIFCGTSYTESTDLARIVANMLRGQGPTSGLGQQLPSIAVSSTSQQGDTLSELNSPSGILLGGQVVEQPFTLPQTSRLEIYAASDDASLFLRSPTDSMVTPDDTLGTPGLHYVYDASLSLEGYIFDNPPAGNWAIRIDGSASTQQQEFATAIRIASVKSVQIRTSDQLVYAGGSVNLQAWIDSAGVAVQFASWNVTVMKPDSITFEVQLYDDGAHADSLASDGIYGAPILPPGPVGFYHIEAHGTIPSDGITMVSGTAFELATFQDLAMDSMLSFSSNSATAGDTVVISGTVRNLGVDPVSNVVVEFWDSAAQFANATVSIAGNGTQSVQATWVAASPDTHWIRVTVSPFTLPVEANYTNNTASKLVVLGQPIVGVEKSGKPKLWLRPAIPNPARGTVLFRFSTPSPAPGTFAIYDIQGRLIRKWQWQTLESGPHAINWDGTSIHGLQAPSGIFFYRLLVNGQILKGRVVRIR